MGELPARPRVLLSGSAVGFYGDRGHEKLAESAASGDGYLAELCTEWEAAAERATALGVRVVRLRTGIVLGPDGGVLARLLPLHRAGLAGVVGDGEQFVPWIHLDDWVELVAVALRDARYVGAVNATAPQPVTQRAFARALSAAVGRAPGPRLPAFVLRAFWGEAASVLLGSQRAVPEQALGLGFRFSYPELGGALAGLVRGGDVSIDLLRAGPLGVSERTTYLESRPPRYVLQSKAELDAPLAQVFEFFSRPENLGAMTPSSMAFRILGEVGPVQAGTKLDYRIRLGALPLRWRTTIERFSAPDFFVDSQERGPYRSWWHEHRFTAKEGRTIMEDRVYYALPFGWLGRLVHRLFVAPALRRIFAFRAHAVRLRFGAARSPDAGQRGAA